MNPNTVLLIDDDPVFAKMMQQTLEKNGLEVNLCFDGAHAEAQILQQTPQVVLLDGSLPNKDGFDICRSIRHKYAGVIIMLTGRDEDLDEILGLELGADDYLTKPVEPRVVLAHIRACMRRAHANSPASVQKLNRLEFGRLTVDGSAREAQIDGQAISLTTAEFDLLWLLASHAGKILSRDHIYEKLRGIDHDGVDRSMDMLVSRLRKQIGDDVTPPKRIKTIRSKGYLFNPNEWEDESA